MARMSREEGIKERTERERDLENLLEKSWKREALSNRPIFVFFHCIRLYPLLRLLKLRNSYCFRTKIQSIV